MMTYVSNTQLHGNPALTSQLWAGLGDSTHIALVRSNKLVITWPLVSML